MVIWTTIGGIVFGISLVKIDDMPNLLAILFIIACGPLAWFIVMVYAITKLSLKIH